MEPTEVTNEEVKTSFITRLREGDPDAKKTAMIVGGTILGLTIGAGVGILIYRGMNAPVGTLEIMFEPAVEAAVEVAEAAF